MRIARQSLIYLSFCLAGVFGFVFWGVWPLWNATKESAEAISRLQDMRETQKLGMPLYADLKKRLGAPVSERLPFPEPVAVRRDDIDKLSLTLDNLARLSGLRVTPVESDTPALTKEEATVAIVKELAGGLTDFRKFLVAVKALPYVDGMEELQIRQTPRGLVFRVRISIRVA